MPKLPLKPKPNDKQLLEQNKNVLLLNRLKLNAKQLLKQNKNVSPHNRLNLNGKQL